MRDYRMRQLASRGSQTHHPQEQQPTCTGKTVIAVWIPQAWPLYRSTFCLIVFMRDYRMRQLASRGSQTRHLREQQPSCTGMTVTAAWITRAWLHLAASALQPHALLQLQLLLTHLGKGVTALSMQ